MYIYIHIHIQIYIHIYIYIEREELDLSIPRARVAWASEDPRPFLRPVLRVGGSSMPATEYHHPEVDRIWITKGIV